MISQIAVENGGKALDTGQIDSPISDQQKKQPKRILYFSDGTLEEYSSEEDDKKDSPDRIAMASLNWAPWFWYQTVIAGNKVLGVCDYLGESLANFFGILTPKYQAELDYYKQSLADEEEMKKQEDLEIGSWKSPDSKSNTVISSEVKPSNCTNEERTYIFKESWTHDKIDAVAV